MERSFSKLSYVAHGELERQEEGLHIHPIGQLLYAEKGVVHIEYADRKMLLPMQFCSWIPPFKSHSVSPGSSGAYVRAVYFESQFCTNKAFAGASVFPLSNVLKEMIRYTARWDGETGSSIYETTFLTVIRQMLPGEMGGFINLEVPISDHPRLLPILDYIAKHYDEQIRVEELETRFGFSGRTLHRLFTKELGLSFSAYLMFLRITKAIELLSEGKHMIKEVTYAVGYSSIPSFSKMFKVVTGQTPKQFAEKMKPTTILVSSI